MNILCRSLCKNLNTYAFLGLIPRSGRVGYYGRYTCNILTNGKSSFTNWKFRKWIIDLDVKSKIIIPTRGKRDYGFDFLGRQWVLIYIYIYKACNIKILNLWIRLNENENLFLFKSHQQENKNKSKPLIERNISKHKYQKTCILKIKKNISFQLNNKRQMAQ